MLTDTVSVGIYVDRYSVGINLCGQIQPVWVYMLIDTASVGIYVDRYSVGIYGDRYSQCGYIC